MSYLILLVTFVITMGSQAYIKSKYSETKEIKTKKGMTGYEVARKILDENGLKKVKINRVDGVLSDHYDPANKTVNLSSDIYSNTSIASVSVASHECGHAIQDKDGYTFLRIRRSIVPVVNLASRLGYLALVIGLITSSLRLFWIGIIMEFVILAFQVITLPVEFNASRRALKQIDELGIVTKSELSTCRGMLTAAALTYVAAVATAILEIMRLLLIMNRNERR